MKLFFEFIYLFFFLFRWAKLRAAMIPITILLEPMTECMLLGLLSAWAVFYLFYWDPISFFLIHVLVWFLMDWILIHIVQNGSLPCNKFEFLVSKIDPMRQILTWVESLLYVRMNLNRKANFFFAFSMQLTLPFIFVSLITRNFGSLTLLTENDLLR